MKKITLLLLTVTLILILSGCKKLVEGLIPNIPADSIPTEPTPTAVGTPVGDLVTKMIGTTGGSIASADGNAELIFPAGALAENTNISVQAVTQTAPNGAGYAYQFLPDGIKFQQPVILKFHYTADDLAATIGDLMGIAFQDNVGGWWRVTHSTNDTVNKIISAPIKHFTAYSKFDALMITPSRGDLKVGSSMSMQVDFVAADEVTKLGPDGDEEVSPLITVKNKKVVWSVNGVVNGNAALGTITGSGMDISFKAPGKVPKQNPVTVSATIDIDATYDGKKYTQGTLLSNIRIIDGEKYLLEIREILTPPFFEYKDSASMMILVNTDGTVAISDIDNNEPETNPGSVTQDPCTLTWIQDGIGVINVTGVAGKITSSPGNPNRTLLLTFTHTGTVSPKFTTDCGDGDSSTAGGDPAIGFPSQLIFNLSPDVGIYFLTDGDTYTRLTLQE